MASRATGIKARENACVNTALRAKVETRVTVRRPIRESAISAVRHSVGELRYVMQLHWSQHHRIAADKFLPCRDGTEDDFLFFNVDGTRLDCSVSVCRLSCVSTVWQFVNSSNSEHGKIDRKISEVSGVLRPGPNENHGHSACKHRKDSHTDFLFFSRVYVYTVLVLSSSKRECLQLMARLNISNAAKRLSNKSRH